MIAQCWLISIAGIIEAGALSHEHASGHLSTPRPAVPRRRSDLLRINNLRGTLDAALIGACHPSHAATTGTIPAGRCG